MTAQGKITTAKLTRGTKILATPYMPAEHEPQDGTLTVANRRTGSIVVTVDVVTASAGGRVRKIVTDRGALYAFGHNTHFLATDNDVKRVRREARKVADRSQAAADSATVLAGVTYPQRSAEAVADDFERLTGHRSLAPVVPKPASPASIVTPGTVKRGNRTLSARHILTMIDGNTTTTVEYLSTANDNTWLPAGKTVARTFARTLGAPVESKPAEAPRFSDADALARATGLEFTLTEALTAVLPDPKKVATARMADGRRRAAERRAAEGFVVGGSGTMNGFVTIASKAKPAVRHTDGSVTRADTGARVSKAAAATFRQEGSVMLTDGSRVVVDGEQASGVPATTGRGALAVAEHFPNVTVLGSPVWARPADAAKNFRALAAEHAEGSKAWVFWTVQAGVADSHDVNAPRPKL